MTNNTWKKNCSLSLVISEMLIKITIGYYYTCNRKWLKQKLKAPNADENAEQMQVSYIADGNAKWNKNSCTVLIKFNIHLTVWPNTPTPTCPPEWNKKSTFTQKPSGKYL